MPVDDLWHLAHPPVGSTPCGKHGKLVASGRHLRGKRWRVRYADDQGNEKTRLFERVADAETFDVGVRADVARGTYLDPDAGRATLRKHAAEWLDAQTFGESTRETTESRLNTQILPVLGDRELRALKPSVIQAFIRGMQSAGRAPSYIENVVNILSTILNAAVDDGAIPKNPCKAASVSVPSGVTRKVAPWTMPRVLAVADALADPYEATVYAGYGLGMRQGEILGLAEDDIDWLRFNVHVCRQIRIVRRTLVFAPPKGNKERDIPLSDETSLRLAAHVKQHGTTKITLPWLAPEGKPVTASLLFSNERGAIHRGWFNSQVWIPALVAAGVVKPFRKGEYREDARIHGMHALRHTFASALLSNGVDIRTLAEYLGHTDPGFTLRTYTHLMPSAEARARAAIDLAFNLPDASRSTGTDPAQMPVTAHHRSPPLTTGVTAGQRLVSV
jgi:integrase